MTILFHTDVPLGAPADASTVNGPLGQLDAAIQATRGMIGAGGTAINPVAAPYNADPTGVADSAAAINNAIADAAAMNPIGRVEFPYGLFSVSAPVDPPYYVNVKGAGPNNTIIQASGAMDHVMKIDYSGMGTRNLISDLQLDGNGLRIMVYPRLELVMFTETISVLSMLFCMAYICMVPIPCMVTGSTSLQNAFLHRMESMGS
jgi:hypothetical protein